MTCGRLLVFALLATESRTAINQPTRRKPDMTRRNLIKSATAVSATGLVPGLNTVV